jgi:hypothetical protein
MSPDPLYAFDPYELPIDRTVFADLCRWVLEKTDDENSTTIDWCGPLHPYGDGGGNFRVLVRNGSVHVEKKLWNQFRQGFFWRPAQLWVGKNDKPNEHPSIRHPLAVMLEILSWVEADRLDKFGAVDWWGDETEEGSE